MSSGGLQASHARPVEPCREKAPTVARRRSDGPVAAAAAGPGYGWDRSIPGLLHPCDAVLPKAVHAPTGRPMFGARMKATWKLLDCLAASGYHLLGAEGALTVAQSLDWSN